MERTVNTKFYTFNQNNSGGYFVTDDTNGVCETVIIEALSPNDAWYKLQKIGEKVGSKMFDYCPCCGERWSDYMDESDGKEHPEIYGVNVEKAEVGLFRNKAFVHYFDGSIKEFALIKK